MRKIHERDDSYSFLRYAVDAYALGSFRKIRYVGRENLPADGAVIFAPNHCCALMDALAVLAIDHRRKVFVARADIFQNPVFNKILSFMKIMPIHRMRDGFRNVLSSEDTIEKSIDVLNNGVPFCILPEGMHRAMHSLLPLGKGISRIALGAAQAIQDGRHVRIVPIGLEYGDYFRYRSTLLVTIGKPVDVTDYLTAHPETETPERLLDIRMLTAEALKSLIVYLPDDDAYEASWELAKLRSGTIPEGKLQARWQANRDVVDKLARLQENKPGKSASLFEKAVAWKQARQEARVSLHAAHARKPLAAAIWRTLKMLVATPFALLFALASLPGWGVAEILAFRAKDPAFRNSLRCGTMVVLWTLLLLIAVIVLFCTVKWYWALAAVLLLIPAPMLTYDWFEQMRRLASAWRYACNRRLIRQKQVLMDELETELNNI